MDGEDMDKDLRLAEASGMRSVVDKIFPFTEVAKTHEYLESGQQFGQVILSFGS